ncbi:hypothetical protein AB4090_04990 [Acidithiobacillus sp. IBUN Pt1247-S3]|uniref:hypothetical protein n=1 Tax=Acidithiobacillus sp. IBUN Pt1247-S3 TaxID=3166642 RepID=UPI0034E480BD
MSDRAVLRKVGIGAGMTSLAILVGLTFWMVRIQETAPRLANIELDGKIEGKPFFLFASSRLQHGITSAIIVQHKPFLVDISTSQKGSHTVLVKFSYAIRHGYFVHGEATIPTNKKHGVRLPLSNSKDHLKIMVMEHD